MNIHTIGSLPSKSPDSISTSISRLRVAFVVCFSDTSGCSRPENLHQIVQSARYVMNIVDINP